MLEYQDKKKLRRILYAKPTLVFLAVVFVISANATFNMYQNMRQTDENKDISLREADKLRAKQADLEAAIGALRTERGLEEEIRKKFRVVKEGESVIIVVDEKDSANALGAASSSRSFFERFFGFFK